MSEKQATATPSRLPWVALRMVDGNGIPMRKEAVKAYVCGCIDSAPDDHDFWWVGNEAGEGDICHTGNGDRSAANAVQIAEAVNLQATVTREVAFWMRQAEKMEALVLAVGREHAQPTCRSVRHCMEYAAGSHDQGACVWGAQEGDDGVWAAGCEADPWVFHEGGPLDNKMVYCPFCARRIEEARPRGTDGEDEPEQAPGNLAATVIDLDAVGKEGP